MTNINLPPLCPVCGGKTTLKEMYRAARGDGFSCFFRCVDCSTDYPRSISAEDVQLAGLSRPPRAGDAGREPAT